MDRRLKLLFLTRLIPLAERNLNLVELGPNETGKSYGASRLPTDLAQPSQSPAVGNNYPANPKATTPL